MFNISGIIFKLLKSLTKFIVISGETKPERALSAVPSPLPAPAVFCHSEWSVAESKNLPDKRNLISLKRSNKMKKIKIAQIGVMHDHASAAIGSLKRISHIFDLIGYARPDDDGKAYLEPYKDVPEMTVEEILNYPGLDAVAIETNELNLTKYARMAADRGLHIHMDKPGGTSAEDFDKLIDTVNEKKLVFSTGYMYRFNPQVTKALEMAKRGDFGDIYAIEAHMDCLHPAEKRQWLGQFPGGMMFFLGCHLIDLIVQFMGVPDEVIPMNAAIGHEGTTSEDYGMAVLKYKGVPSFAKSCAAEPGGFMRRQLVICGTKGTMEIKPLEYFVEGGLQKTDMRFVDMELAEKDGWGSIGELTPSEVYNRYDTMMTTFAKTVAGEIPNTYNNEYERQLYKIVLASCGVDIDYK